MDFKYIGVIFVVLLLFNTPIYPLNSYENQEVKFYLRFADEFELWIKSGLHSIYRSNKEKDYYLRIFIYNPVDFPLGGIELYNEYKNQYDNRVEPLNMVFPGYFIKYFQRNNEIIAEFFCDNFEGGQIGKTIVFFRDRKFIMIELVCSVDQPPKSLYDYNNRFITYYNIMKEYLLKYDTGIVDDFSYFTPAINTFERDVRAGVIPDMPEEVLDLILKFDEIVNSLEFFDP